VEQTRDPGTDRGPESPTLDVIEKGWTVYDALGRPLGNVTDVDRSRGRLVVDGRSAGFDELKAPLTAVREAGDNDVHLALAVDPTQHTGGGIPHFTDPPPDEPIRPRTQPSPIGAAQPSATSSPRSATAATTPTSRPVAAERDGPAPVWTEQQDAGGLGRWLPFLGLLAAGALGAIGYAWWRRRRKQTYWERAAAFAGDRHPAWWAGLAATVLPLAYYAWPSHAERSERRPDLSRWTDSVSGYAPSSGAPSGLGALGAVLAAAGAALWLARRGKGGAARTRVEDVMTRHPRTIRPDGTVAEAASMMRSLDIGSLPVCDGSYLVGMLSDRDIAVRSTADGRDPLTTYVRDVMSTGVAWASEDDPAEQAARIMKEHRVRRLPIVDERKHLVGIVSLGDLAVDTGDDRLSGETLERISQPTRPSGRP
jgi:CBS domain-containing protein